MMQLATNVPKKETCKMIDTNISAKSNRTLSIFDFGNRVVDRKAREDYATQMVTILRTKQGKNKKTIKCYLGFSHYDKHLFRPLILNVNNFTTPEFFINDKLETGHHSNFATTPLRQYRIKDYHSDREIAQNILAKYDQWLKTKTNKLKRKVKAKDFSYLILGAETVSNCIAWQKETAFTGANMFNLEELITFISNNFIACAINIDQNHYTTPIHVGTHLINIIKATGGMTHFTKLILGQPNLTAILNNDSAFKLLFFLIENSKVKELMQKPTGQVFLRKILQTSKERVFNSKPPFTLGKQVDVKRYNIATETLFKLEDVIHYDIGTYSFSMMLSNLLNYQVNQLNHDNLLQISYRRTFTLENEADLKQLLQIIAQAHILESNDVITTYVNDLKLNFNQQENLVFKYLAQLRNKMNELNSDETKELVLLTALKQKCFNSATF